MKKSDLPAGFVRFQYTTSLPSWQVRPIFSLCHIFNVITIKRLTPMSGKIIPMQTVTRLLDTFSPEHYTLTLDLQRVERRFSGRVTVKGQLKKTNEDITLHAKDLTVTSATINGTEATATLGNNDEMAFSTGKELAEGEYSLEVTFEGTITDAMHGLYPCYYEENGEKKELLATQFESHHAREVFPCVDEPEAKATYDVTLLTEKDIVVLGNMPIVEQSETGDKLKTTFDTTPRMSSYLLAFVTGDLQKATGKSQTGVEVNIWATKAQPAESLDFALGVATKTIDFFTEYFDTPYPLPKADHVALPDFSSGAMENWGLITYREICLLVDPKKTTTNVKQYVAIVVAHELSHQWFGNLVTMKWWDDLWLNESFASLMEYIAVDHLFPEWKIWLNFTGSEALPALRRDALPGVQAVKTDVHHPDEISTLFDPAIVYAKGARTLQMLRSYIGDEAFQKGLKAYFKKHAYQNTVGNDLWAALGEASGKDVGAFMECWIEQSGFPVVTATANGDQLTLTQKQFLIGDTPTQQKLWPIPLKANQSTVPELLDTQEATTSFDTSSYLKLNVGDTAHYITKYDDTLREKLVTAIESGQLSPIDRLQILHEATMLPRAGETEMATIVPLIEAYRKEETEPVWDIMSFALGDLRRFTEEDPEAEAGLRKLSGNLAENLYKKLGWEPRDGESESDALLRATIVGSMIFSEQQPILDEALRRYNAAQGDISRLPSDLRAMILGVAVRFASNKEEVIDRLIELYRTTASSDLRMDISGSLTVTRDTAVAERLLELMKDTTFVKPQDTARWYAYLLRNKYTRELVWNWVRDNWSWIKQTFGGDKSYDDFARYAGSMLTTAKQAEEYREFFTPMLNEPALKRTIEIGLVDVTERVKWIERDREGVCVALRKI